MWITYALRMYKKMQGKGQTFILLFPPVLLILLTRLAVLDSESEGWTCFRVLEAFFVNFFAFVTGCACLAFRTSKAFLGTFCGLDCGLLVGCDTRSQSGTARAEEVGGTAVSTTAAGASRLSTGGAVLGRLFFFFLGLDLCLCCPICLAILASAFCRSRSLSCCRIGFLVTGALNLHYQISVTSNSEICSLERTSFKLP